MSPRSTLLRAIHGAVAIALSLVALIQAAIALEVPPLQGRVNDRAGMLSPEAASRIELLLKDLEERDSTQIVVLTVPSLEGAALEDFSLRVAEGWKIGHKGLDNGAILLIARAERSVRIEVGYGLEGRLTDLQAGRIIRGIIVPEFQAGRFDQGVVNGVQAMIDIVRGEFKGEGKKGSGGLASRGLAGAFPVLILFIFLVSSLGRVSRPLGTAAGGCFMPLLGHMVFSPGVAILAVLAGVGLIAGFILSTIAGAMASGGAPHSSRRSGRGPGGLSGGFFSGGGFSSGRGGFSGGGGGFGGGGASGRW